MKQHDRDREPTPARMKKHGTWDEFLDGQPNRTDDAAAAGTTGDGKGGDRGKEPMPARIDHDDPVEEASDESFPASDPPSFSPGSSEH